MSVKLNKPAQSPVRLQDIADLAQTSVATVSMSLAGNARISPETRQRICELSQRIGYRPRNSKRIALRQDAMKQQRLHFGFLALDRLDTPLNASIFQDLAAAAARHDIRLEVASVDVKFKPENVVDQAIRLGSTVDGLIIMGAISSDQLRQIRQAAIPAVMYGYPLGAAHEHDLPAPIITNDWQAMGRFATQTLLDRGHKRIGFVCGEILRGMWHDRCLDGYVVAHAHAGLPVDTRRIFEIVFNSNPQTFAALTQAAAAKALALKEPPTAYVLINQGNAQRFHSVMAQFAGKPGASITPENTVICGASPNTTDNTMQSFPLVHMDPAHVVEVALAQLRSRCTNPASPCTTVLVPFGCQNL